MAGTQTFLASVADVYLWAGSQLILQSKTMVDSSITIGVTAEEIRAGKGASLIGRYFHTSVFSGELNDAVFQLDFIAMNVGVAIDRLGTTLTPEQFTATQIDTIEVNGTPASFLEYGNVGWYAPVGSDNWTLFEFDPSSNISTSATGVQVGQTYCVRYINNSQCEEVVVPANIVPSEVTMIMVADLYKAAKGSSDSPDSKIGAVEFEIPRFQLNGNMDLTLNMTGAAQTPLSGQALETIDESVGCDGGGYYAKIKKFYFNDIWQDNIIGLAVKGGDEVEVAAGSTTSITTIGVFSGNVSSREINPSDLVYTVADTSVATVTNGVVSGLTAGSDTTVTITLAPVNGKTYTVKETVTISVV